MFRRRFWRPRPIVWRRPLWQPRFFGLGCTFVALMLGACVFGMFVLNILARGILR